MNALARAFTTRRCYLCKTEKPLEDFSPQVMRCRPCQNAYNKNRLAQIRAGTWKPQLKRSAQAFVPQALAPPRSFPAPQPRDEEMLRVYLEAFMVEFGFTALKVTYTRLEGEIARKHRLDIAREGWIA